MDHDDDGRTRLLRLLVVVFHEQVYRQEEQESFRNDYRYGQHDHYHERGLQQAAQQQQQQQQQQSGAERHQLLFTLYLCLLICCCVTPIIYYLRLFLWQRVRLRQLRELEHAGLMAILQQTMLNNERYGGGGGGGDTTMAESTMVQQERKARINQMMEPVRKVLESNDFRDNVDLSSPGYDSSAAIVEIPTAGTVVKSTKTTTSKEPASADETSTSCGEDTTDGFVNELAGQEEEEKDDDDNDDEENERRQIRVPPPGIVFLNQDQQQQQQQQRPPSSSSRPVHVHGPAFPVVAARWNDPERWVPASCPICLSSYEQGSAVVWSSNAQCHHVFHAACMEMWLFKQHEEPICPCCRREFLVDPYDLLDNVDEMMEAGNSSGTAAGTGSSPDPGTTTDSGCTVRSTDQQRQRDDASTATITTIITGGVAVAGAAGEDDNDLDVVELGTATTITTTALSNGTDPGDYGDLPGV